MGKLNYVFFKHSWFISVIECTYAFTQNGTLVFKCYVFIDSSDSAYEEKLHSVNYMHFQSKHEKIFIQHQAFIKFGSVALTGKMLLSRIVENNEIDAYFREG